MLKNLSKYFAGTAFLVLTNLLFSCSCFSDELYRVNGKNVPRNVYNAALQVREACSLIKENNLELAISRLKRALTYDPHYSLAHANLGIVLARIGNDKEALVHLKASAEADDCPPTALLNLASFYQTTGDLNNAIKTMKLYIARNDEGSSISNSTLELLEKEQKRRSKAGSKVAEADYFRDVIGEHRARWSDWHMPLKVFIAIPDSDVEGYKSDYDTFLRQAFIDWEKSSNKRITFRFVDSLQDSDIDCRWTNDPSELGNGTENGNTQTLIRQGALTHAKIALRCRESQGSFPLTSNTVTTTCRHEVGHALGLAGHSVEPKDLMYFSTPISDPIKTITTRDRNTLLKVYEEPIPLTGQVLDLLLRKDTASYLFLLLTIIATIFGVTRMTKTKSKQKKEKKKSS